MIAMAKHKPASLPAVLPEGRLVHVSFEVRLPATATPDQVEDWLNLHMGCGGMDGDNPLLTHATEPFTGEAVLTDTRSYGTIETFELLPEGVYGRQSGRARVCTTVG